MAYEDFIQGIRPQENENGELRYPLVAGRFLEFCDKASNTEDICVLIVDEINRANLSRVFGELMYLLEYRDKAIKLAAGKEFMIPSNVRIIGTMNTADRSIALVDHALRRRFAFLSLYPDYDILRKFHRKVGSGFNPEQLISKLESLNKQIGDRHYSIGPSYFLREDIQECLEDIWQMEIEPYLEEFFFDQPDNYKKFTWKSLKLKFGMIIKSEPLQLVEYQKHKEPKERISENDAEKLWRKFNTKISIEHPTFINDHHWELTSQGYVGFIPVSDDLNLSISPKIPLRNLFGMWEYAYRLKNIEFLGDLFEAESLQEFYSQLANILAKRVIDRSRKGYYRAYLTRTEDLSYLKGKLDLKRMITTPWIVQPRCSYQEHTADIDENQILAWTLYAILRSGFCSDRVYPSYGKPIALLAILSH